MLTLSKHIFIFFVIWWLATSVGGVVFILVVTKEHDEITRVIRDDADRKGLDRADHLLKLAYKQLLAERNGK